MVFVSAHKRSDGILPRTKGKTLPHSKMGVLLESMKVDLSSNKAVTYTHVFKA